MSISSIFIGLDPGFWPGLFRSPRFSETLPACDFVLGFPFPPGSLSPDFPQLTAKARNAINMKMANFRMSFT